jgi:hypothetical protein
LELSTQAVEAEECIHQTPAAQAETVAAGKDAGVVVMEMLVLLIQVVEVEAEAESRLQAAVEALAVQGLSSFVT